MRGLALGTLLLLLLAGCTAPLDDESGSDGGGSSGAGGGSGSGSGNGDGDAPPPGAPNAALPTWATGQSWTYHVRIFTTADGDPAEGSYTLTVLGEETAAGVPVYRVDTTRSEEDTLYTRAHLNPIHDGEPVEYTRFPLWVGKTWAVTGGEPNEDGVAKVEAQRRVTTSAGVFDTYRIQVTYDGGGDERFYYAPAVANFVRMEVHAELFVTVTELTASEA